MLQMASFIFYGWVVLHCMYICIHVYIYCLSVDRHLGCFRILVMLLWTLGCIFLFKLVFSFIFFRYIPRSRIPWSYGSSVFGSIWGTSILFAILAASIYIPTNSVKGFYFLHIRTNICSLWPFWWQPLWLCEVWGDLSWWFWCAFFWQLVMLNIFLCGQWPSVNTKLNWVKQSVVMPVCSSPPTDVIN